MNIVKRILATNVGIGSVTVPIYILFKNFPFVNIFLMGLITTFSVIFLSFYFLGVKFTSSWAILQKVLVTLPTSLVLSHIVKHIGNNPIGEYVTLFTVGYIISTPLIFLSYNIIKKIYKKK
jgi:hypothetical protein